MSVVHPGLVPGTPEEQARAAELAAKFQGNPNPPAEPGPSAPTASPLVKDGKFFGKYATEEEAAKGFDELLGTLSRRNRELDEQKARLAQVESALVERANPAPKNPYDDLAAIGIDPNPVRAAIQAELQQALAPIAAGMRAKQVVAQEFPEYVTAESEVARFLGERPDLNNRFLGLFQTDPVAATEWAYLRYRNEVPGQRSSAADEAGKAAAALPGAPAGGRSIPPENPTERLNDALQYYRTYGDERPVVHERLKGLIPDEHFNQG